MRQIFQLPQEERESNDAIAIAHAKMDKGELVAISVTLDCVRGQMVIDTCPVTKKGKVVTTEFEYDCN